MDAPLVNDYKKSFILRRLLETFLGGLKLYFPSESAVPLHIYFLQILFFLLLPLICGTFFYLLNSDSLDILKACLGCGFSTFLYGVFLITCGLFIQRQGPGKGELEESSTFGDEEVFVFDSLMGPKTWRFLFPQKKFLPNTLIHPAIVGFVFGSTIFYLDPSSKRYLNLESSLLLSFAVLGIFIVTIGVWPLLVGNPPELATFYQLPFDLQALTRSSHLLTCYAIHAVASSYPDVIWLYYVNCFAHLVFVFAPFLWVLGALPPIDAYVLWAMEQWVVVIIGGSPASSNRKLIAMFLQGTVTLLLIALIPAFAPFVTVCSVRGFLTSVDLIWLVNSLKNDRKVHNDHSFVPGSLSLSGLRKRRAIKELILLFAYLLGVLTLGLAIHIPLADWYALPEARAKLDPPQLLDPLTVDILWICSLIVTVSLLVIYGLQSRFIFGVRNFTFLWTNKYERLRNILAIVCNGITLGGPFLCLLFIHVSVGASGGPGNDLKSSSYADAICRTISYCFIYRRIWQYPEQNLVTVTILFTTERILAHYLRKTSWLDLNVAVRIHLFSLFLMWLNGLLERLRTMVVISFTSIAEFKQRKFINFFIVGFNIAAFPILLMFASVSSVFSFPLFPLFTLPLFLVGFPRPLKFWPYPVGYSANTCSDSIYYQQMIPYVSKGVHEAILAGKLGFVQPGDLFLLRWEDRFFWMQILESGFLYHSYSFKGLELQETSCHTVEASRVDSIFNRAFDPNSGHGCLNDFPLHCLAPLTQISAVGYSETRNVLTGVFDSPDTLGVIKDYFLKTLLFLLVEDNYLRTDRPNSSLYRTMSVRSRLGSADLRNRKVYSTLPKADKPVSASRVSLSTSILSGEGGASIQSGRGSRMAWVSENRSGSLVPTGELKGLAEGRSEKDGLGGSLSTEETDTAAIDNNLSRQQQRSSEKYRTPLKVSLKAKGYLTSVENFSEEQLAEDNASNEVNGNTLSSTDSESESTKDFFTKSWPKRPKRENSSSSGRRTVTRINRKLGKLSPKQIYNCSLSASLAPPSSWILDHPFEVDDLEDLQDTFPVSWFKFLLTHFGFSKVQQTVLSDNVENVNGERLIDRLLEDEVLEENYRMILAACQSIILGTDISFSPPSQVLKLFMGDIPKSTGFDWICRIEKLHYLTLRAYRIAVKLSLDHTLVGPVNNSWIDLQTALEDYTGDWFVGPDDGHKETFSEDLSSRSTRISNWNDAVSKETPSLFSIGRNDLKGVYTSHMLTLGKADVSLGRLDRETVRALWASLTGELLYLTNDDDERYSIQAHPVILRNLTVQAADPPLGYPIFSSPPLRMGLPLL